jgi:hypothetical protein
MPPEFAQRIEVLRREGRLEVRAGAVDETALGIRVSRFLVSFALIYW